MANNDPRQVANLDVITSAAANDRILIVQSSNSHVGTITVNNFLSNTETITVGNVIANLVTSVTLDVGNSTTNNAVITDLTVATANVTGTLTIETETVNTSSIVTLQVNNVLLQNLYTPADSTSDALAGAFWSDGNYVYFATANGSIKRAELLTF